MRTLVENPTELVTLAAAVDCLTESELELLAGVPASTIVSWRRFNTGPDYCQLGTRYLYPYAAIREFIARNLHSRQKLSTLTLKPMEE